MVVLILALLPTAVAADGNERPLAEAGLDQTATRGAPVYLDATGSHDPDGELTETTWTIRHPNGTTRTPDCATCPRTTFTPQTTGTYAVTVRVTDDDGATASDTLYVTVEPGDPPTATLDGPDATPTGDAATYRVAATAGTAPLATISWYVDGTRVRTTALDAAEDADTLTHYFDQPGDHTVHVRVTDDDDTHATARTHTSAFTTPAEPTNTPDAPDDGANPTTAPPTTDTPADTTPLLRGPRVVTGEQPLTAPYRVTDRPADATTRLYVDDTLRHRGHTATLTLAPGVHDISATTDATPVRFPDNTTTVIADPAPTALIHDVQTGPGLTVTASATDALHNLDTLTISLDGTPIHHRARTDLDHIKHTHTTLRTTYRHPTLSPGNHTLTITATDTRNQTTTATKTISAPRPPEIISANFVGRDDRTAYDHRLSPQNYIAHHITKIALNGATPADVTIQSEPSSEETFRITTPPYDRTREYDATTDTLILHDYWAVDIPRQAHIGTRVLWNGQLGSELSLGEFRAYPSDPVIRYTIDDNGMYPYFHQRGMVINASRTFDPDDETLEFEWKGSGAVKKVSPRIAKAESLSRLTLVVRDGNGGVSRQTYSFTNGYVPPIGEITEVSSGPYQWNDSVQFRVSSSAERLLKNRYERNLQVGIRILGEGRVLSWDKSYPLVYEGSRQGSAVQFSGVVSIPAKEFVDGNPSVELFNEQGGDWNAVSEVLPDVWGLQQGPPEVVNESVIGAEYLVERPTYTTQVVRSEQKKNELLGSGYEITSAEQVGMRHTVEERRLVAPAQYETEYKTFSQQGYLEAFLSVNDAWREGASSTTLEERSVTEYEWRDSRSGSGQFTGETRRVLIDDADYKTYRQYRYDRRVQRTGTKTVTRYRMGRVPYEVTEQVRRCNDFFGCYWATVTETRWKTVQEPYQTTVSYTYWTTETETYWGLSKRSWDHEFTGQTSRVKVQNARYGTEYRYSYERTYTERVTTYTATRQVQTSDPTYEWVPVESTSDILDAASIAADPTQRISESDPITAWTMQKRTGTQTEWVDTPVREEIVAKTRLTVRQTLKVPYVRELSWEVVERKVVNTTTRTVNGYEPAE
ncbi:PKD domain-containing protein [Salarchaeum japonicum]|uniref:PKD domain-containing protein n=1 Tax=Salarchaeum japonicum TaxID=555573 RepID=UPI001D0A2D98|nr:PKD domain-containing protein [Salarchaeum japonicum]